VTEQDRARYLAAMHGVQSGVALKMNHDGGPAAGETSPKHLRTGVNAAMVEHSALVKLLVDKGVIPVDEYEAALADAAERERVLYEQWADAHYGREPGTVHLG
jgi:hypothetical protein